MTNEAQLKKKLTLLEVLEKVVDKGVIINGELVISVANVDLIFLGVRLILTSVENFEKRNVSNQ
jgi:hypothetical protein